MAKVQIKSEKLTPFGGIFSIMEKFLWRLMRGRCNVTTDAPSLVSSCSDTILRAIKELTQENISYTSDQGKTYDFNTADNSTNLGQIALHRRP